MQFTTFLSTHISHLLPLSLTSCHLLSQELFFAISLSSDLSLYFLNEKVGGMQDRFEEVKGKYVLWIQYIRTTHKGRKNTIIPGSWSLVIVMVIGLDKHYSARACGH